MRDDNSGAMRLANCILIFGSTMKKISYNLFPHIGTFFRDRIVLRCGLDFIYMERDITILTCEYLLYDFQVVFGPNA